METKPASGSSSFITILQAPGFKRGFTLIELLMVMALVGILSTMVLINLNDFKTSARIARSAGEIRGLEKDIISFATEKGDYPNDLGVLGSSIVKDPWGNPYVYKKTADIIRVYILPLNTDFDLYSVGADGATADLTTDPLSADDIVRGDNGAFCGIAKKYGI